MSETSQEPHRSEREKRREKRRENGRDAERYEPGQGDRYDFERLERSVEYLLDEHARLGAEREALLAELADREHRVAQLEADVVSERQRRAAAVEGVDKILTRLEQLQASVAMPTSQSEGRADASVSNQEASEVMS
ncbi:MAG: hypothetical protein AB8G23_00805 [Myxococcota bacterium]